MSGKSEYRWQATGRRKTSVARVYLTPGTGKWDVNGRTLGDYFPRPSLVLAVGGLRPPERAGQVGGGGERGRLAGPVGGAHARSSSVSVVSASRPRALAQFVNLVKLPPVRPSW